jgi:hypothetical protein
MRPRGRKPARLSALFGCVTSQVHCSLQQYRSGMQHVVSKGYKRCLRCVCTHVHVQAYLQCRLSRNAGTRCVHQL